MFGQRAAKVRLRLDGVTDPPLTVHLLLVHPTRAELDRSVELHSLQAGWYEGEVAVPDAARWHLQLEDPRRAWRLTGEWRPGDGEALVLTPRG
jgi:hypothetical protein